MDEPVWISKRAVLAVHEGQLAEHGGSTGLRDESLLDSALAKPHNVFAYSEQPELFILAASYAFGIARNHAFIDGNKRTALVVSMMFLDRNGWEINAPLVDVYVTFLSLAEGTLSEQGLAAWFKKHAVPLKT
jgi:death-on-curing protein